MTTNANEFERVGGFIGRLFVFRDGTLTIDSDGVATFAARLPVAILDTETLPFKIASRNKG